MQNQTPRRKDRAVTEEEARKILDSGEYGIFATVCPDGSPYAVPMNYIVNENQIILHCATSGRKLDNIRENPKVTFCVVGNTKILPQTFTSIYESVIVSGAASIIEDVSRKIFLLKLLGRKYSPDFSDAADKIIDQHLAHTAVIAIDIESISGKANRPNA
ncbi:MAG: pyridoxamine 5'-phosphate oxidase family protein [Thermoguttaceae bacterium]